MYGILLISGYIASYLLFSLFLQLFFQKDIKVSVRFIHIILILVLLISMIVGVSIIPDPEWGNRFQHAFGGGFLIVLIFFLSSKVSGVSITIFQFISLGILFATLYGVANEVLEYFLQRHLNMIFTTHIYDTWLDLISNTIGAIIAVAAFSSFLSKDK